MAKGSGNNRYLRRAGGGLPGRSSMGGNANALAQAQELLAKAQAELAAATVEGTAGGGAVRITMSGEQKVLGIKLEPDVVDPEDVEMLQDLIMAAIADATQKAAELQQKSFGAITGGLGLPGLGLG